MFNLNIVIPRITHKMAFHLFEEVILLRVLLPFTTHTFHSDNSSSSLYCAFVENNWLLTEDVSGWLEDLMEVMLSNV